MFGKDKKEAKRYANKTDVQLAAGALLLAVIKFISTYREYNKDQINTAEAAKDELRSLFKKAGRK